MAAWAWPGHPARWRDVPARLMPTLVTVGRLTSVKPAAVKTLRLLIFIVCTNWLVGLLRALYCLTLGADNGIGILFCALEVGVTAAAVFALMRRTTTFTIEDRALAQELSVSTKYARSALDLPARTRIRRKLDEAMSGRLHRDSGVTCVLDHLGGMAARVAADDPAWRAMPSLSWCSQLALNWREGAMISSRGRHAPLRWRWRGIRDATRGTTPPEKLKGS